MSMIILLIYSIERLIKNRSEGSGSMEANEKEAMPLSPTYTSPTS